MINIIAYFYQQDFRELYDRIATDDPSQTTIDEFRVKSANNFG